MAAAAGKGGGGGGGEAAPVALRFVSAAAEAPGVLPPAPWGVTASATAGCTRVSGPGAGPGPVAAEYGRAGPGFVCVGQEEDGAGARSPPPAGCEGVDEASMSEARRERERARGGSPPPPAGRFEGLDTGPEWSESQTDGRSSIGLGVCVKGGGGHGGGGPSSSNQTCYGST